MKSGSETGPIPTGELIRSSRSCSTKSSMPNAALSTDGVSLRTRRSGQNSYARSSPSWRHSGIGNQGVVLRCLQEKLGTANNRLFSRFVSLRGRLPRPRRFNEKPGFGKPGRSKADSPSEMVGAGGKAYPPALASCAVRGDHASRAVRPQLALSI